jgi:hypothetical protein
LIMMNPDILEKIRLKNLDVLRAAGYEVNPNLPLLDLPERLRSIEEIAQRINILHIFYTIQLEGRESLNFFSDLIRKKDWGKYLSSQEKKLLQNKNLSKQDLVKISWYKESIYALLWSCKQVYDIKEVSEIDISDFYRLMPPELDFEKFLKALKLRDISAICDVLDYYYNLHWIAKHQVIKESSSWLSRLNLRKKENLLLNESLIRGRRKALEWVLYGDQDWDIVNLDT